MAVYAFDDLVEAITNAAIHARKVTEQQHISLMEEFFERDVKTGQLKAKTVELHVPSLSHGVDEHEPIQVPLITLVPMNSLHLTEVSIDFKAHLSGLEDKSSGKRIHMSLTGGGILKKQNEVNVRITVKGTDPPEGLVRINERIMKQIP